MLRFHNSLSTQRTGICSATAKLSHNPNPVIPSGFSSGTIIYLADCHIRHPPELYIYLYIHIYTYARRPKLRKTLMWCGLQRIFPFRRVSGFYVTCEWFLHNVWAIFTQSESAWMSRQFYKTHLLDDWLVKLLSHYNRGLAAISDWWFYMINIVRHQSSIFWILPTRSSAILAITFKIIMLSLWSSCAFARALSITVKSSIAWVSIFSLSISITQRSLYPVISVLWFLTKG